jgi:AcrR family transcriptional regulator
VAVSHERPGFRQRGASSSWAAAVNKRLRTVLASFVREVFATFPAWIPSIRIIDVCLPGRILESDGLRGFNTNAIAAKAGVSIGSLYQYFPNKDSIVLALIGGFEKALHDTVVKAVQDGKGKRLNSRLRLVVRALVSAHYYHPRLNRVLESEEERLGSEANDSAFHANLLQLLEDHKKELAIPVSRVTERVFMAILRAVVDLGLASGASPRSTEQRALRAICGYLLYAG